MNDKDHQSVPDREVEKLTIELYKTAFARLTYQDEHLFKFSTVFLTAHGALAVLAGTVVFKAVPPNYQLLAIVSVVGIFLAITWALWTHHNDYWHSVWTGTLRGIEKHLATPARVFDADHKAIAKTGNRSGRLIFRGHTIALLVPVGFALAWGFSLYVALGSCAPAAQQGAPGDGPAAASQQPARP